MTKREEKSKYGTPLTAEELPEPGKRLPQYDDCLKDFLKSDSTYWKVNIDALPSKKLRVVLSSLKWRTKHRPEFRNVRVFMRKKNIFLEKVRKH